MLHACTWVLWCAQHNSMRVPGTRCTAGVSSPQLWAKSAKKPLRGAGAKGRRGVLLAAAWKIGCVSLSCEM